MNTKKRRKTMYVDIAIIIMIVAIIMIKLLNDDIKYAHQNQQQQETTRNVVESVSELEIEQHTTAIVGSSMEQIIRERATAEPTTAEPTTEETTVQPTTEEETTTCFMIAPAIKCEVDIDDFRLMCRIVMNEAGGNSYKCQLAVAETIVNRVNSENYPNNIYDVVYQPYQYSHANNGDVTDSVREAVTQALEESTFDNSMVFFRDWYYHGFAEPYMEIDDMCFSLKKE